MFLDLSKAFDTGDHDILCQKVQCYVIRDLANDWFKSYLSRTSQYVYYNNMFFSLKKDSKTRGHEVKLVKDQCRLDIRKHSFSQRTINEWNKLSTDRVTASSVNMFKNKVDTYLRRAGYK